MLGLGLAELSLLVLSVVEVVVVCGKQLSSFTISS